MGRPGERRKFPSSLRVHFIAVVLGLGACVHSTGYQPVRSPHSQGLPDNDPRLDAVVAIHGGAGPWVVAGYRMGGFALEQLGLARGTFDIEVTHFTPREVQYSCIADGAAAATGASLGKLNLALDEAEPSETRTAYRKKSTGQTVVLRPSAAFTARYLKVAAERLRAAGEEVLALPNAAIFEVVP